MKKLILLLAVITACSATIAAKCCKNSVIRFADLPFAEGAIYVSVSYGEETILQSTVEVESDTVTLPVDLSKWEGKEIKVKAFQDLNDNKTLDFDAYGRPQEPCLQTTANVDSKNPLLEFKLVQY